MKRITIIGNSVALRVRPPESDDRTFNKVYGSILEEMLNQNGNWTVFNFGLGRRIVTEFELNRDLFIRSFPDYFVINLGCVDAPTREISLRYSDIIFRRRLHSLYRPANWFYSMIVKRFLRKPLVRLRGKKSWVSKKDFGVHTRMMIGTLLKETSAQIIVLGINKGNKRVEENLPGTLKNYSEFNEILKSQCDSPFTHFIDVSDLSSNEHFPDGVHYNSAGHKLVAERIFNQISKLENE